MNEINKTFLSAFALLATLPLFAQAPPPATPIDGGLGLLLAGGAAYGIKKIRERRKEK